MSQLQLSMMKTMGGTVGNDHGDDCKVATQSKGSNSIRCLEYQLTLLKLEKKTVLSELQQDLERNQKFHLVWIGSQFC